MIIDTISNFTRYKSLNGHFIKAIDFVQTVDLKSLKPGKHEISGEDVFLLMNEYRTKPVKECPIESHRKYIDIQLMLEGTELFGYAAWSNQEVIEGYNEKKDYVFYKTEMQYITLTKNHFAIFFPTDLHQPGIIAESIMNIKKAVVKVRMS